MKKLLYLLIITFLVNNINVYAASCTGNDLINLQKEANNIKVNHEIIKTTLLENVYDEETHTFKDEKREYVKKSIKITLYNMSDDLFIVQSEKKYYTDGVINTESAENSNNDEYTNQIVINYKDTSDGIYSFETDKIMGYTDYKFEVYSNINSCDTTLIKTINYRKPRYNLYSENPICEGNPTSSLCQEFITKDIDMTNKDFDKEVQKSSNSSYSGNTASQVLEDRTANNFLKDNLVYIVTGGVLIIGAITTFIIISKKRRAL